MEASLGSKPSFAWRSILSAKDLLQQGVIWRVGNGQRIKVWGDRWVPKATSYLVQTPPRVLPECSIVAALIDRDTRGWNINLLKEVFFEEEVQVISNIPLSPLSLLID
jgi:hypothetical protein